MLIDSNIIIYSALPKHEALRELVRTYAPAVSVISYIEVLGFHSLKETERHLLQQFFGAVEILPLSGPVAETAILLRQRRRISLGDSIVAATAIESGRTLVTHNLEDFKWIDELKVMDPLATGT
jgi:predicted nucleic acid-binding protein